MPGPRPAPADAPATPTFHLGYRPALDGLRAVAVVLVLLHHTAAFLWPSVQPSFATGGFLGVDIFFVLSGFLITTLLLARPEQALGRFYLRRVRRLVPGLLGMLAFLGVCGLVFDAPSARDWLSTVIWVTTYSGNWGVLSTHHIAPEVSHTWSLAVEGQFYVVWPVITAAVLRIARGRSEALAGVAVVGIAAVMAWRWHAWHQQHNWLALYIRTPARADALLIGCLAGLAASSGWVTDRPARFWQGSLAVGLPVLIVLAFTVEGSTGSLYDGGLTAIAVIAALVVLGALFTPADFPTTRVLASRPFVAVGTWSYSLYLWHFPLFFLLREHAGTWPAAGRTIVGWVLAFAAAIASYRFVERPFLRRPAKAAGAAAA